MFLGEKVLNEQKCFTCNVLFLLSTSPCVDIIPTSELWILRGGVQCGDLTHPRFCRDLVPKEGPAMGLRLSPGVSPSADKDRRMPSS